MAHGPNKYVGVTVPKTRAYAPKLAIVSFLKPKNFPSLVTASSACVI